MEVGTLKESIVLFESIETVDVDCVLSILTPSLASEMLRETYDGKNDAVEALDSAEMLSVNGVLDTMDANVAERLVLPPFWSMLEIVGGIEETENKLDCDNSIMLIEEPVEVDEIVSITVLLSVA